MSRTLLMELKDISKHYPSKRALNSVSLQIERGSCTVLQGRNGSGKSTLIKIIGGLIVPTSGKRILHSAQHPVIRYVADRFPRLKFTAIEYLTHMGNIEGLSKDELPHRIENLHKQFHLSLDNKQYMCHY